MSLKKSTFRHVFICDKCQSLFNKEPEDICPICKEDFEIRELIKNMKTTEEYRKIKIRTGKLDDSMVKFDLYNLINRTREKLEIRG